MSIRFTLLSTISAGFMSVAGSAVLAECATPIKVGVLHSLSGSMAISETTLKDAMLMLIEQQNAKGGVGAKAYHQHLTFVGQLEKACQQQLNVISKATLAADQRKQAWLEQQKRRKAVELLLEKKAQEAIEKANRAEQAMMDEFAMQRHFRAHHVK